MGAGSRRSGSGLPVIAKPERKGGDPALVWRLAIPEPYFAGFLTLFRADPGERYRLLVRVSATRCDFPKWGPSPPLFEHVRTLVVGPVVAWATDPFHNCGTP